MTNTKFSLRPAVAADQATIKKMVRSARLGPFGLDWPNFQVAEIDGRIVGIGQIKPHGDGSRELASLAVLPQYQGRGIGTTLVNALLAAESSTLYLYCEHRLEGYYKPFGFHPAVYSELPKSLSRQLRLINIFTPIFSRIQRRPIRIIAMKREPDRTVLRSAI